MSVELKSSSHLLRIRGFVGGVCRNSPGFPQRLDGELRRPGMVNFKALPRPPEPRLEEVPRELLAKRLALSLAPHGLPQAPWRSHERCRC